MVRTRFVCGLLLACLLPTAHAAAAPTPGQTAREYELELLLSAQLSFYASESMDDGALFGGSWLGRHSIFAAGNSIDMGGALFEDTVFNASLLGGLAWQTDLGLRLDLLGQLGVDHYHSEDGGLLSDDPGVSVALGCGGARAGLWYRFRPRGNSHFILGVYASYLENFHHVTRRYSYLDDSWFGDEPTLVENERSFGGRRMALTATVGMTFDLLPR